MSIIFVFLDGLGLSPASPHNPLSVVPMPAVQQLLGGPLTLEQAQQRPDLLLRPIDANLGVEGLPQSGTGHVALFAGVNAPALHGRHQPNFPPVALRPLLAAQSVFLRARQAGHTVAFANAFTSGYWAALEARRIRRSASLIAAEGAGLEIRNLDDLRAGRALAWDISGAAFQEQDALNAPPLLSPATAGTQLALLAQSYDLVFFECFLPDLAGHGRLGPEAVPDVLARIDGLIGGILAQLGPDDSLLITSDHGNLDDATNSTHNRNPVPLLVAGPAAPAFGAVYDIAAVANAILLALAA